MRKQLLNLKFLLMLCMIFCIGGGSVAFAEEGDVFYTLTAIKNTSNSAYANNYDVTVNGLQWSAPGNQSLGDYWRIGGKDITNVDKFITGKSQMGKTIGKVTLNHNGKSNNSLTVNSISLTVASDASFTNIIETVTKTSPSISVSTAGSIDFEPTGDDWAENSYYKLTINVSNSSTSKNYGLDFTSLVFYEGATGSTPSTATLTGISVSGTAADLWTGDDFTHDGITVTATYDDESTADVTNSCSYSGYDMSTTGDQTVTVTYGEKTATYTVNVKTIGNTKETAYTVAKAIELIDAGKGLKTPVYVKGTVSSIVTAFDSQYGNISFNVSDNGTTEGTQFEFFRNFKGENNEKYTSEDECPKVGDEVIGYGTLTKYNTTYEFAAGNYLVEKIVSTDPSSELTLSQATGEVNVDKTLDIHGFVSTATGYTGTVTYAVTSGPEYASVNAEGVITGLAVGEATIKVTAPAVVGSFSESSAEFTVTVVENRTATTVTFGAEVDDQTFNVNLGETFEGKTATVSPTEAGNVTYSSDKPEVASVDENTGAITIGSKEGTATITASFVATETYQASSAKYYITVTDPNGPVYKKVTSNDDIVDGEQYLIICEDNNKAMSSSSNPQLRA